jgi:hypothetical protein
MCQRKAGSRGDGIIIETLPARRDLCEGGRLNTFLYYATRSSEQLKIAADRPSNSSHMLQITPAGPKSNWAGRLSKPAL